MAWHSRGMRRVLLLVSIASIGLVGTLSALASPYTASPSPPQLVPDHPLPLGCQGFSPGTNYPDAEVEPYIDVDRASGKQNLIAVYQQDRFRNGGAHGLWTSVSHNGGTDWSAVVAAPAFSRCTGGTAVGNDYERSSDPWVSISPNGAAYQIAIVFHVSGLGFGGPNAVLVSKSTDAGDTWSTPIALIRDTSPNVLNDKESLTADPNTSNNVYAVWDRLVSPSVQASEEGFEHTVAFRGPTWFSRTTNGGASWEPARIIFDPGELDQTIGNVIRVAPSSPTASTVPGGQLLDGFDLILKHGNPHLFPQGVTLNVAVLRSFDRGTTWDSRPTVVDQMNFAQVCFAFNCATSATRVRTGDIIPEFAVDRTTGYYYATWQDARWTGHAQIAFSMSTDGGATWSRTIRINPPDDANQSFTPMVHVADDGTVGVAYYRLADPSSMSDVVFVHCHQSGPGLVGDQDCSNESAWSANGVTHVAGPFDMARAPIARGHFVGDYFGLTDAGGSGFRPFYNLATLQNLTDNFTNTVFCSSSCSSSAGVRPGVVRRTSQRPLWSERTPSQPSAQGK